MHSVYTPGKWLTGGYWDDMTVLPFAGEHRPRTVAILGSAAGTTARAIAHYVPGVHVDAVELDPAVTKVGRELFDLRGRGITTHAADARPWLDEQKGRFDAILVDAYRQPYIPFYLTTKEFFERGARPPRARAPWSRSTSATPRSRRSWSRCSPRRWPACSGARTCSATASTTPTRCCSAPRGATRPGTCTGPISPPTRRRWPTGSPTGWRRGCAAGSVYTDDRAPVEWLVDLSLAQVAKK